MMAHLITISMLSLCSVLAGATTSASSGSSSVSPPASMGSSSGLNPRVPSGYYPPSAATSIAIFTPPVLNSRPHTPSKTSSKTSTTRTKTSRYTIPAYGGSKTSTTTQVPFRPHGTPAPGTTMTMFVGHMTTVRGGTKEVTKTRTVLPYMKITNVHIGSTSPVDATISVTPTLGPHTSTVYGTTVTEIFNQTTTAYAGTKEVTKTVTVPYDTEMSFATPSSMPTVSYYSPSVSIHDLGNVTYTVTLTPATTSPPVPSNTSAIVPLTMSKPHSSMHLNASTTVAFTLPTRHPYTHSNASTTVEPTISTPHPSTHSNTSTVSHHAGSSGLGTSSSETTTERSTLSVWTTFTSVSWSTIGTIRNDTSTRVSTSTLSTRTGPPVPLSTTHAPSSPIDYAFCNKTITRAVTVSKGTDGTSTSLRTTVVPCNKASTHTMMESESTSTSTSSLPTTHVPSAVHTLTGHTLTSAPTATTSTPSTTSHSSQTSSKPTISDLSLSLERTHLVSAPTLYSTSAANPSSTPAITSTGPPSAEKQSAWQFTFSETYSVNPNPFQGKGSRAMGTSAAFVLAGVLRVALLVL